MLAGGSGAFAQRAMRVVGHAQVEQLHARIGECRIDRDTAGGTVLAREGLGPRRIARSDDDRHGSPVHTPPAAHPRTSEEAGADDRDGE